MNTPVEQNPNTPVNGGFDLNRPTIVGLLYLGSFLVGITALVGVVLAYVWKGEEQAPWEVSHFQYLIGTFWIGLIGGVICAILMFVFIGFLLAVPLAALIIVRCVLSLVNAQKRLPMPNPDTWLV